MMPKLIFTHSPRLLVSHRSAATWLRSILIVTLLCALPALPLQAAPNANIQVQTLTDLRADAVLAQRQRIPILIAFFASYCEWCERVEQEFLRPMLLSGDYTDKVIIRKLDTDGYGKIIGLDGKAVAPGQFSYQHDAYLTPTLIFVDHRGRELSERMIGLTTPEMYGGYLDNAIDHALSAYRSQSTAGTNPDSGPDSGPPSGPQFSAVAGND